MEEEWWPRYAIPNLADDTRRRYLEVWGTHLLPRVGGYELRAITSLLVEDLRDQLTRAKVPAPTQRKVLMLLQGILRRAVVRGLIPANPVQLVAKPKQAPTITPQPLAPLTVERIRAQLRARDAMIVSLLAYVRGASSLMRCGSPDLGDAVPGPPRNRQSWPSEPQGDDCAAQNRAKNWPRGARNEPAPRDTDRWRDTRDRRGDRARRLRQQAGLLRGPNQTRGFRQGAD